MLKSLGLRTELITPVSIILLLVGAFLGYGSNFIVSKIFKSTSAKTMLFVKFIGLIVVFLGMLAIFSR